MQVMLVVRMGTEPCLTHLHLTTKKHCAVIDVKNVLVTFK